MAQWVQLPNKKQGALTALPESTLRWSALSTASIAVQGSTLLLLDLLCSRIASTVVQESTCLLYTSDAADE